MATSDGRKAGVTPPMTVSAAPDDAPMLSVKAPEPDPSEQLLALQDKLAHGMGPAKFEQEFKKIQAAYFGALPFSPMHGGDRGMMPSSTRSVQGSRRKLMSSL
ncbi:hypothetical protein KFE25_008224 [Diacronema lutheri]|uniref:Uncharacterized protein n=1 Tax=Diacronema lutheri TaxID=2081491 RepID=A0A8J5XS02_DIALT|nr:hypothetical protein KFE25_008224 [Diacronema lutheri]